jgi:hypothetical protein
VLLHFASQDLKGLVGVMVRRKVPAKGEVLFQLRGSEPKNFSQVGNHAPRIPLSYCKGNPKALPGTAAWSSSDSQDSGLLIGNQEVGRGAVIHAAQLPACRQGRSPWRRTLRIEYWSRVVKCGQLDGFFFNSSTVRLLTLVCWRICPPAWPRWMVARAEGVADAFSFALTAVTFF